MKCMQYGCYFDPLVLCCVKPINLCYLSISIYFDIIAALYVHQNIFDIIKRTLGQHSPHSQIIWLSADYWRQMTL